MFIGWMFQKIEINPKNWLEYDDIYSYFTVELNVLI